MKRPGFSCTVMSRMYRIRFRLKVTVLKIQILGRFVVDFLGDFQRGSQKLRENSCDISFFDTNNKKKLCDRTIKSNHIYLVSSAFWTGLANVGVMTYTTGRAGSHCAQVDLLSNCTWLSCFTKDCESSNCSSRHKEKLVSFFFFQGIGKTCKTKTDK